MEERRADLGALANEHERFGLAQSLGERVDVLDVIVPDLDVVSRQLREAVERAQRVVVVVEDGDLHRGRSSEVAERARLHHGFTITLIASRSFIAR